MPSTPLSPDVLPVIGTTYAPAPSLGPAVLLALGVWSLVGIAFYVWYLWSLSRLFPRIGLPSSHGWIPVWNQWQLVQRGGLPGWLVLFGLVPGLSVVAFVVSVIAIHRLNVEHGKGGGFTVLGALLPPVWAMLLASAIEQNGPAAAYGYGAYGAAPAAPDHAYSLAPAPQGGYAPAVPQTPVYAQQQAVPPAQPQQPWQHAPVSQPAAADQGEPVDALARLFAEPQQQAQPQQGYQGQQQAPRQQPGDEWGFSRTTEGDYQRLAQEGYQQRQAPVLGGEEPARPFAWPSIEESNPKSAPAPPQAPAPQTPQQPPAPAAPAAGLPGADLPPIPQPVPPQPVVAPDPAPAEQDSFSTQRPSIFDSNPDSSAAPGPDTETARSEHRPGDPADPATAAAAAANAAPPSADDDELDRTVVVPRRARWGLELPDGEVLELRGDDIVVGRKPEARDDGGVLQIADPTRTLSKSHARLRRAGESWTIEDLDSTNGVALVDERGDQVPLEAARETPVTERLVIGTLEVTLRRIS